MNLFGVGPLELVVILVVALIFVGPDRLPRLAADIARTIREIRKYTGSLAAEFQEVVKDVEKQTESERGLWKDVTEGIGGATKQVTDAVRTVRTDVNTALAETPPAPATNGATTPTAAPAPTNGATNGASAPSTGWVEIADPDGNEPAASPPQTATPGGPAS
jgi:sec-independent protein translocase protein TatB